MGGAKRVLWLLLGHVLLGLTSGPANSSVTALSAAPANFQGSAVSMTSIAWSWDASLGATSYELHAADHTLIANVSATGYTETSLSENTAYTRHVHSREFGVLSAPSSTVSRFTLVRGADTSDFTVTPDSASAITIAITNPPVNLAEGQTGVRIFRTSPSTGVVSAFSKTLSATDTGLLASTQYCYNIEFQNGDAISSGPSPSPNCAVTPGVQNANSLNIKDCSGESEAILWFLSMGLIDGTAPPKETAEGSMLGKGVGKLDSTFQKNDVHCQMSIQFEMEIDKLDGGGRETIGLTFGGRADFDKVPGPVANKAFELPANVITADRVAKDMAKVFNNYKKDGRNPKVLSNPNAKFPVAWEFCADGTDEKEDLFDEAMPKPDIMQLGPDPISPDKFTGKAGGGIVAPDPDKGVAGQCLKLRARIDR